MSKKSDIEALTHFLSYSEQEARRLGLSAMVITCLRMAAEELTKAISDERTTNDARTDRPN